MGPNKMTTLKNEQLGTAFRAALLSGDFIMNNLGKISKKDITTKQASDFVTYVDKEAEAIIISTIQKTFPDHVFLAEESAHTAMKGEYRWIIDPLDGTTNFIHGFPLFCVSIALEYRNEIILGLIYDPLKKEMFSAEKDCGAFLNGKKISVSSATDPGSCLISTGFPFRKKEMIIPYLELFKNLFHKVSDIRRAGSAALDLAYLACGRCDGFFEIGLSPWDIAAGVIIVNEAGGKVTDFNGEADFMESGNIVAASSAVHDMILKDVKNVFDNI